MHQCEVLWSRCCREGDKVKTQGACQWWVTRALALRVCRKEFPQRQKVVKQVKCFLGGKSTVHVYRGRVPESCPGDSLSYFYVVFPLGFLWPIILTCLVHSPYLMYLRSLPGVRTHLLAKKDSTSKAYGYNIPWHDSPLASKEPPLCMCGQGGFLTLETRNMWSVQAPASSLLFLSWSLGGQ